MHFIWYCCTVPLSLVKWRRTKCFYVCTARKSKKMTATVGERVTLQCRTTPDSTPIDWYYIPSKNETVRLICSAGIIGGDYTSRRFTLNRRVQGDFSLVIHNVTLEDAGVYICTEDAGQGVEHRIQLLVHGKINIAKCFLHCVSKISG